MREKDIIITGLKIHFKLHILDANHVEFKRLAEITELMGEDDYYSYSGGKSHSTYSLIALYGSRQELFENTVHHRSGSNHEPDTTNEGEDLEVFLHNHLDADCFLLHYSHSASWESDDQDEETLYVVIPSEREKRKFLFTIRKQYMKFVGKINKELLGHAGDDDHISVLVPVEKKNDILKLIEG